MPATFTIPLITVISGQTITASGHNNEFENIDTNFIPAGMDDYSATDTEMRVTVDPYPASATSRPTSLQGELERIRYVIAQLSGETYWYVDPQVSISTFKTNFDAHTHSGAANQGPQIAAAGLASDSVITAKILDSNVTLAKLASLSVDENKLTASVAGNGLAGGAGIALSVNVDSSTIEISSDSLRVKDGGITSGKLAASIQPFKMYSSGALLSQQAGDAIVNLLDLSVPCVLKSIAITTGLNPGSGAATWRIGIVVDGVTYYASSFSTGGALTGSAAAGAANTSAISFTANTSSVGTINDLTIFCNTSLRIYAESTGFTDGRWKVNLYVTYAAA